MQPGVQQRSPALSCVCFPVQPRWRVKDRPAGPADVQDDYEVWGKSWGEILDAGERKLRFFQEQLNDEATDDRVTQYVRATRTSFPTPSHSRKTSRKRPSRRPPRNSNSEGLFQISAGDRAPAVTAMSRILLMVGLLRC